MESSRQTFSDQNREAVERARDRWNLGDLPGYMQLYDSDVELHGYAGVDRGLENVQRFYDAFWKAFPGSQLVFEDIISAWRQSRLPVCHWGDTRRALSRPARNGEEDLDARDDHPPFCGRQVR